MTSAEDHALLSRKLEEACDFAGAAQHALAAGDARRAAHLAALGGDDALCAKAIDLLVTGSSREQALATAVDLAARGFHIHAGDLYERAGAHLDAAGAFVAGGNAVRAAECFERAGRPADGARALEAAIRRAPDRRDEERLALGRLLSRHGKIEAAVRSFQQIDASSPQREQALPELFRALEALGLHEAAREVRDEMRQRGVGETAPASSASSTRAPHEGRASVPPGARTGPASPSSPSQAPSGSHASASQAQSPSGSQSSASQVQAPSGSQSSASQAPGPARPVLHGRYEVVRDVAATPHARLVEAIDRLSGERVAVKTFASSADGAGRDAWQRFEREARALMLLRHPHVVPLRAYLPEAGAMVLAWMGGGSLADKLAEEPIAPARAAEITSAVLAALGEAHRLGILHRDVKPSNILFDEAGAPHLSDFGAAHLGDLSSTATAGAIGTFAYMSPEQRLGRPATLTSDLYGAGAVLAEMLTGEPPTPGAWGEGDDRNLLPSECHPDLRPEHDAIVRHLVEPDPEARPTDAFAARRELSAVTWPSRLAPRAQSRPRAPSVRPAVKDAARLVVSLQLPPGATGVIGAILARDTWLDREVVLLPFDDAQLERARAFARALHSALPAVLRADAQAQQIWVAPPEGEPLRSKALTLTRGQRRRLRDAVTALHAAGGAHGSIDADHIHIVAGDIVLAYPLTEPSPSAAEADLAALAALEKA
ncbi:MAG: protein kinase [Polyangiaceae bacterium]